eukprot:31144-Pelagococcus_subviridis.AAC.3
MRRARRREVLRRSRAGSRRGDLVSLRSRAGRLPPTSRRRLTNNPQPNLEANSLERLLDEGAALHARHHHLVPVKVREVLARGLFRDLLTPRARRPLTFHVRGLHRRRQSFLAGGLLFVEVDDEGREREASERHHAAVHARGVDENLDRERGEGGGRVARQSGRSPGDERSAGSGAAWGDRARGERSAKRPPPRAPPRKRAIARRRASPPARGGIARPRRRLRVFRIRRADGRDDGGHATRFRGRRAR